MSSGTRRAVFLDRDGVLNALVARDGGTGSPRRLEDFRLVVGADAMVRRMRGLGLLVFVVTNQPDIARGRLSERDLLAMTEVLRGSLQVDEVAVCPHDDPDGCGCRKPKPGMLLALADRWSVDLGRSFVVGDSWRDVEAGRRAGCRTVLINGGPKGECVPDRSVATLEEAVEAIASDLDASWAREANGLRS